MDLVELSYRLTKAFPRDELFGLTSQIRRASVSIPSNIAEGYGRDQTGGYVQFLKVAQGSLKELETQLLLALRLELVAADRASLTLGKCEEVGKMLRALIRSLQRN
jgi:four helix bundle protein